MKKRLLNILIFIFIFALYFVTFLFIYDTFRDRKLNELSKKAEDVLDKKLEKTEKKEISEETISQVGISYSGYTIIGKIQIPKIGFNSVILKEYTYAAMNLGVIKSYGVELNQKGGFVLSGHNFKGRSTFMYSIKNLKNNDKIIITNTDGVRLEYTVYSVERNVSPNETSYLNKTDDYHVTLVTCENGGKQRIVVKARVNE